MPVLIRRIIVYSATACALIYLTIVLQNIFTDLLERAGLTDAITLGGLPDLISRLPIFADMRADITALAIGLFGWLGIRYDQHKTDKWSGNKVRAVFLAGLTVAFTLRILPELLLIVRNVETLAQNDLPIATPLASALACAAAATFVQIEWALGRLEERADHAIAKFCASLGQWATVALGIWAIGQFGQSVLQTTIAPLPLCSTDLNIFSQILAFISQFFQQCTDTPPWFGALLSASIVIAALALYIWWSSRYNNDRIRGLSAIVVAALTGTAICFNAALAIRFLLDIITRDAQASFPRSLLSTPGEVGIASYPFAGPIVSATLMLAYFTWRERHFLVKKGKDYGMLNGLVTLSFPVGLLFFFGGWVVFGHAFVALLHIWGISDPGITSEDWKFGFMFLIPGALFGILLAKVLHEIARSKAGDVTAQGRFYTKWFLWGTRATTALSIALVAAIVITDLLDTPIDPTNYWWPHLLAVIGFNIPFIRYFQGLRRRWPQ